MNSMLDTVWQLKSHGLEPPQMKKSEMVRLQQKLKLLKNSISKKKLVTGIDKGKQKL